MQTKKLHALLRVIAVVTTALYLGMFFWKLWSRSTMLRETGMDIDWAVPANPRSMIALCLITATVALLFLRSAGRVVSGGLFLLIVAFYIQWGVLTNSIRASMGSTSIPSEGGIGNFFIGAGVIDLFVLIVSILMILISLLTIWQGRQGSAVNRQQPLYPRHS